LFTYLVFLPLIYVGIGRDLMLTQYSPIPSSTLLWWRDLNLAKKYTSVEEICGDTEGLSLPNIVRDSESRDRERVVSLDAYIREGGRVV
jgi:hypothetical protein